MAIASGTRLGPYEVLSPLGAGGMGEVYRARDTRLDRTVAIKILPAHLSADPIRKQRFEREAKAISGLNHPHICVLFDVGQQDGIDYLVMECLEGETLAGRIEKGPVPLDQVLKYGAQIADALDKAHRSGITHRDLKPGNIMLTPTGAKLLDFGLAKPSAALAAGLTLTAAATQSTPVTADGIIVGTFQYMSPEQIEGKVVDGRSDIFSLGSVLYEMLTGQRAFPGKSQLSVASAILEKEPAPIANVKPLTPPALDHAIRRCLAKDPEERWQTARDLQLELKWMAESGSQLTVSVPGIAPRKSRERLAWGSGAVLVLLASAFAIGFSLRTPKRAEPMRLSAELGAEANWIPTFGASAILSPDGTHLAVIAMGSDQKRRIYVRSLDQLKAVVLSGTENSRDHFFSPDGQWLGFFADGKVKKISIHGGAAAVLCDAPDDRGGSWSEDGTIVFSPLSGAPLLKVSSSGGTPQPLTTLDIEAGELTHRWPQVLPGGKAILFTSSTLTGNYEDADIVLYSIDTGKRKSVHRGGFHARYVPTGHLVYMHEGTLFGVPFDIKSMEVTGQPSPVIENVVTNGGIGGAQFSFSQTGNLVYIPGSSVEQDVFLDWMSPEGKFSHLRQSSSSYFNPVFAPDGKRLALTQRDGKRMDIWVYALDRDTLTRLTFTDESNARPIWTPDGRMITYASLEKGGHTNIYSKRADGGGDVLQLTKNTNSKTPSSWHPNGKILAFTQVNTETAWDIMTLTIEGNEKSGWKVGEATPFLNGPFSEQDPVFSPDGRWIAYCSNESGNFEVYVRPFPGPGGKWQVSTGGGWLPKWSHSGKELFYRTTDSKLMVASYKATGDSFDADKPRLWSTGQFTFRGPAPNYDVHPDGKRVLVLKSPDNSSNAPITSVSFILNFFEELRHKLPPAQN
jgi:serine/threonine protein kinase/Tol biopolymer transport system component